MMGKRDRLEQEIAKKQEQWNIFSEKLASLEKKRILAIDESEKIKLDHEIAETQQERQKLEQQLVDLENQLDTTAKSSVSVPDENIKKGEFDSWFKKLSFRNRYNTQIKYDHRVFNVSGLRTKGGLILEVEKVFVELRIAHSHAQQANVNPLVFKELSGNQPVWEFLRRLEKKEAMALAIIGAPGCGKTTMLQHIALTFAANQHRQHGLKLSTPIFLFLREHVKIILEHASLLGELAQAHFSNSKRYPELKPPANWFADQLKKGNCLVLLDGLDEVANAEQRQTVSKWVDEQIRHYPRSRFVVTSRPQGYRDAPLTQAHVLEVMAFSAEQVQRFIQNWYLANKILAYGKDDPGVRQDAERGAEDLLGRLRSHSILSILTTNPLLLTMITMVHNYRNVLPEHRVELYAEICDVLLSHWQKAKQLHDPLSAAQKRSILQPLAAEMMAHNTREIVKQEALTIMLPHLKQVGLRDDEIPLFLDNLQASSGLLVEKERDLWSFAHLTFQEYLCAAHWQETGEANNWDLSRRLTLITNSWWHETLRIYAAQADATILAETCLLLDDNVSAMSLAADITEEARKLAPHIRSKVEIRLEQNLEADDSALRRLAAEVRLNRRLKHSFQPIDGQREIDSKFITCAEYQLFLDDMRVQDQYHQPEHWGDFRFLSGQGKVPITGVCFKDAEAFCNWLTRNQRDYYRLPTNDEVKAFPIELPTGLSPWGQDRQLLSLRPETETEIKKQLSKVSRFPLPSSLNFINSYTHEHEPKIINALISVLALDFIGTLNRISDREHKLSNELESIYYREHELSKKLERVLARKRELPGVLEWIRARKRELEDELKRVRVLKRKLYDEDEYARVRAREDEFSHELEQVCAHERELPDEFEQIRAEESEFEGELRHERAQKAVRIIEIEDIQTQRLELEDKLKQGYNIESTVALILSLVFECKNERASTLALILARISDFPKSSLITTAIETKTFIEAQRLIQNTFSSNLSKTHQRQATLLALAVKAAQTKTFFEWRHTHHELAMLIADYAYQDTQIRTPLDVELQKILLDLSWYYRIILARAEGKLPAWEGIRLVRERR